MSSGQIWDSFVLKMIGAVRIRKKWAAYGKWRSICFLAWKINYSLHSN
jgi:hypothetical protein